MDIKDIVRRLSDDAEGVCWKLFPAGKVIGHEFCIGDVHGTQGESLKVMLKGPKRGLWSDFGDKEKSGDLLDLWRHRYGLSVGDALREVKEHLGIQDPAFQKPRERKQYRRPPKPADGGPVKPGSEVDVYLRTERGLFPETLKLFGIAEAPVWRGVSKDGRPIEMQEPWVLFPFLRPPASKDAKPELVNIKWLALRRRTDAKTGKVKKIIIQEKDAEPALFGWQAIDPNLRWVIICEGEIDAMTWRQWGFQALSTPAGAGTGDKHTWIETEWERLEAFETIYLAFDMDEEGEAAVVDVAPRLGLHRCRRVTTPQKDANACLLTGATVQDAQAWLQAAPEMRPEVLRSAAEFFEETLREFYPRPDDHPGIALPWESSYDKVRLRYGEVSLWTGVTGHGKTTLIQQVINHAIDQGESVCVGSFEMKPKKLLHIGVRQAAGAEKPTQESIRALLEWMDPRLWMVDVVGKVDRKKLLEEWFKYARRRYGCRLFIIDSLLKCSIAPDDYKAQDDFMDELTIFARDEDCHIALVAHPRKPKNENDDIGKLDVRGSGGIIDQAFVTFVVRRNKRKEQLRREIELGRGGKLTKGVSADEAWADLNKQPDSELVIDKQRNGTGWEGPIDLWFNAETRVFRDGRMKGAPRLATAPKVQQELDVF